jgi:hypothetical protein
MALPSHPPPATGATIALHPAEQLGWLPTLLADFNKCDSPLNRETGGVNTSWGAGPGNQFA